MRLLRYISMAIFLASISACGDNAPEELLDRLVEVKTFSYQSATRTMDYPGRTQARYETELAFQVEGRLINRLVEVGEYVKQGQPIARLDPKDYILSSERFLNQKRAAEANHKRAKSDLIRARELLKKNFIGQSDLDKAINLEKAAQAALMALKAEYTQSLNQHGYTQLLASADGIVTGLYAEVGDVIQAGSPVAKLAWANDWEFVTAVAETDVNQLSIGQVADIKFWAYADKTYSSLVREISPISNTESPSYKVKLSLVERPESLKLGMTGHVLFSNVDEKVGLLPAASIVQSAGQSSVFIVDLDTHQTRLQAVTLGQAVGNQMSILSGLSEGELIVVAGANLIVEGSTVRLLKNE